MRALIERWNEWWFRPDARHQSGVLRISLLSWYFLVYSDDYLDLGWLQERPVELISPSITNAILPLEYPWSPAVGWALLALSWLSLTGSLFGIFTRISLMVFTPITLYLEGVRFSYGYFGHSHAIPALLLVVLCAAPGVSRFSIDAWLEARKDPSSSERRAAPEPIWAVRMTALCLAWIYLAAGIAKLRYGALPWLSGETLARYLTSEPDYFQWFAAEPRPVSWIAESVQLGYPLYKGQVTAFGLYLGEHRLLSTLLAAATLIFELAFPVMIFLRRWQLPALLAAVLLHLGIYLAMGVDFRPYLFCYVIFVDWRPFIDRLSRLFERPSADRPDAARPKR